MKIFWGLDNSKPDEYSLAIGAFDGIHLGHQKLVKMAIKDSQESGRKSGIVTFNPHPRKIISGRTDSLILLPLEDKIRYFHRLGIDSLFLIDFNESFSKLSPHTFIQRLLEYINIKKVFIGFNFHFGYKGEGNVELLKEIGDDFNFKVEVIPPVKCKDEIISSTIIRSLIKKGKVDLANKMLGHLYFISGDVVKGHGRGRSLGFSTANIEPDNEVIPRDGVYATITNIGKHNYKGLTNIGHCPTYGNSTRSIEATLFNFNKKIYGKWLKIYFLTRIRDEQKFNDPQHLSNQINRDFEISKSIFRKKHLPIEIT